MIKLINFAAIVEYFEQTMKDDPSTSEAVAAIKTLIEFMHLNSGMSTSHSFYLNLHSHDLRVPVGSLSRFKLSLPQCNVPGVLNCMSGRLSGCPSLY